MGAPVNNAGITSPAPFLEVTGEEWDRIFAVGVRAFTRALARELGPRGITVNSVAPGLIDTDITGGALEGECTQQLLAGIPVGRNGNVADLITYLCREESGYISGATHDVNGGAHIH